MPRHKTILSFAFATILKWRSITWKQFSPFLPVLSSLLNDTRFQFDESNSAEGGPYRCTDPYNCVRGYSASCLMTHPGSTGAAYGYPGMGNYRGAQTELVRIPFTDANCLRLSGEPGDDLENDFVLLADAFPSGVLRDRTCACLAQR